MPLALRQTQITEEEKKEIIDKGERRLWKIQERASLRTKECLETLENDRWIRKRKKKKLYRRAVKKQKYFEKGLEDSQKCIKNLREKPENKDVLSFWSKFVNIKE